MKKFFLTMMFIVLIGFIPTKAHAMEQLQIGTEQSYACDGDMLYFTFTTPARTFASYYRFTLTNITDNSANLVLFSDSDHIMRLDTQGKYTCLLAFEKQYDSGVYYLKPSTTYYIVVGHYDSIQRNFYGNLGKGVLKIKIDEYIDDLSDEASGAQPIVLNQKYQYELQDFYDTDFVCFTTPNRMTDSTFGISFEAIDEGWISLYLYDSVDCTNQIDYISSDSRPLYKLEPNHTYYCKVNAGSAYKYNIKVIDYQGINEQSVTIQRIKAKKKRVTLNWHHTEIGGERADKYFIYRATKKNGKYKLIDSTSSNVYIDKKVKRKKKYFYKIRAAIVFRDNSKYYSRFGAVASVKTK